MNYDKIKEFKQKITSANSIITFKLEGSSNYDFWWDEVLTQTLAINMKYLLQDMEFDYLDTIINPENKWIWEIKNKKIFNVLLDSLKLIIR